MSVSEDIENRKEVHRQLGTRLRTRADSMVAVIRDSVTVVTGDKLRGHEFLRSHEVINYRQSPNTASLRFKPLVTEHQQQESGLDNFTSQDGYVFVFEYLTRFLILLLLQFVTPLLHLPTTPKKVRCRMFMTWGNTKQEKNKITASLAHGEYLRTHFKNMREVAAALSGVTRCIYN